jgi:hypothetical protein
LYISILRAMTLQYGLMKVLPLACSKALGLLPDMHVPSQTSRGVFNLATHQQDGTVASMIAMQRIALLLAVCGTFAVSVQAQAKGVKTAAAIPSMAEYDTADFTHVCLRANSIHNCDLVAVVSGLYIE